MSDVFKKLTCAFNILESYQKKNLQLDEEYFKYYANADKENLDNTTNLQSLTVEINGLATFRDSIYLESIKVKKLISEKQRNKNELECKVIEILMYLDKIKYKEKEDVQLFSDFETYKKGFEEFSPGFFKCINDLASCLKTFDKFLIGESKEVVTSCVDFLEKEKKRLEDEIAYITKEICVLELELSINEIDLGVSERYIVERQTLKCEIASLIAVKKKLCIEKKQDIEDKKLLNESRIRLVYKKIQEIYRENPDIVHIYNVFLSLYSEVDKSTLLLNKMKIENFVVGQFEFLVNNLCLLWREQYTALENCIKKNLEFVVPLNECVGMRMMSIEELENKKNGLLDNVFFAKKLLDEIHRPSKKGPKVKDMDKLKIISQTNGEDWFGLSSVIFPVLSNDNIYLRNDIFEQSAYAIATLSDEARRVIEALFLLLNEQNGKIESMKEAIKTTFKEIEFLHTLDSPQNHERLMIKFTEPKTEEEDVIKMTEVK